MPHALGSSLKSSTEWKPREAEGASPLSDEMAAAVLRSRGPTRKPRAPAEDKLSSCTGILQVTNMAVLFVTQAWPLASSSEQHWLLVALPEFGDPADQHGLVRHASTGLSSIQARIMSSKRASSTADLLCLAGPSQLAINVLANPSILTHAPLAAKALGGSSTGSGSRRSSRSFSSLASCSSCLCAGCCQQRLTARELRCSALKHQVLLRLLLFFALLLKRLLGCKADEE